MKTVWKFPVSGRGWTALPVGPEGKVVLVGLDPASSRVSVWLELPVERGPRPGGEVPASLVMPERLFRVLPTGEEIEDAAVHVGSVIDERAGRVWHVYERLPAAAERG